MPEENLGERTEPATPRRRQEARERGHVSKSLDLSSAVILLAALLGLAFFGRPFIEGIFAAVTEILGGIHTFSLEPGRLTSEISRATAAVLLGMTPLFITIAVAALGINLVQVGFLFTGVSLEPNLERLDPLEGLKRIFSVRSWIRLFIGLSKLLVLGVVLAVTMWAERDAFFTLLEKELGEILQYIVEISFVLSIRATLALLVLAILDFALQRWQYEKDLRMSRQEIREEAKRLEGDPKIRERRRHIQRQIALQRMMQRVPRATVVITNPTEYAVALEYDREKMAAPTLAAKGVDFLAQRIREVAAEHGIPIVQRPEVARAIYRSCEVGQPIPYELYQAVAEILAYVYRLKGTAAVA